MFDPDVPEVILNPSGVEPLAHEVMSASVTKLMRMSRETEIGQAASPLHD